MTHPLKGCRKLGGGEVPGTPPELWEQAAMGGNDDEEGDGSALGQEVAAEESEEQDGVRAL
jgi:hypothetical protein